MTTIYKYNFGVSACTPLQTNLQSTTGTNALHYESIKTLMQHIQAFTGSVTLHISF